MTRTLPPGPTASVIPEEPMRANGERRFDAGPPASWLAVLHEIPHSLALGSASGMTGVQ